MEAASVLLPLWIVRASTFVHAEIEGKEDEGERFRSDLRGLPVRLRGVAADQANRADYIDGRYGRTRLCYSHRF